jgi:hypothetical protein
MLSLQCLKRFLPCSTDAFFAVSQTVPVLLHQCFLCSVSNGSCVALPKPAIHNQKPCILGRGGMSNAALLWDVYHYFMAYAHILARIDDIFWNSTVCILKRHFTNDDVVMMKNEWQP